MRAPIAILAGLCTLAACATGVPVEREVVVSGSRFQAVQGEARLVVRTFLEDVPGERREVVGATCAVVSSLYTAELQTPARLVVPNFGPQSPELSFTCRAGDLAGQASRSIATYWRDYPWGYPAAPYPAPGALIWGGWDWYGPAYPVSDYPDVSVTLRRGP